MTTKQFWLQLQETTNARRLISGLCKQFSYADCLSAHFSSNVLAWIGHAMVCARSNLETVSPNEYKITMTQKHSINPRFSTKCQAPLWMNKANGPTDVHIYTKESKVGSMHTQIIGSDKVDFLFLYHRYSGLKARASRCMSSFICSSESACCSKSKLKGIIHTGSSLSSCREAR